MLHCVRLRHNRDTQERILFRLQPFGQSHMHHPSSVTLLCFLRCRISFYRILLMHRPLYFSQSSYHLYLCSDTVVLHPLPTRHQVQYVPLSQMDLWEHIPHNLLEKTPTPKHRPYYLLWWPYHLLYWTCLCMTQYPHHAISSEQPLRPYIWVSHHNSPMRARHRDRYQLNHNTVHCNSRIYRFGMSHWNRHQTHRDTMR